ncbi:MAG: hypothetical protein JWR84_65 [Caulobacter sp.]|nr:hypothetical protein [Caulobacter sp.]
MERGLIDPSGPPGFLSLLSVALAGTVGAAVMMSVVARTGRPRRPPLEIGRHVAVASATVLASLLIYGFVGMWLGDAAEAMARSGAVPGPLAFALSLLSAIYQIGLFALLGMTMPAAGERPAAPWTAAAVALKLSEGQRLRLAVIAMLWSAISLFPVLVVNLVGPNMNFVWPFLAAYRVATAFGIGVLYLELRRLRTGGSPEATAETFA